MDRGVVQRLSKNFSISFAGSLVSLTVGLGRTALLTKYLLSLEDYGRLLIVLNLFSFLIAFLGVRVQEVLYQFWPQFEHAQDRHAQRSLFFLSVLVCTAVGLVGAAGIWAVAPWISERWYEDPGLAGAFRLYALAAFTPAFEGLYTALLRIRNRFTAVVIPQVLSGVASLVLIGVYMAAATEYRLEHVVLIFAFSQFLQDVPPLIAAVRAVWPTIRKRGQGGLLSGLRPHRKGVYSSLFQSNLSGYLKIVHTPGDVFLLGIFATPAQVALYGIAARLISPIKMLLQRNLITALSPEIATMWAKRQLNQLYTLVKTFLRHGVVIGGVLTLVAMLLARPVLLVIARPEYLGALPAFYLLILTTYMTLSSAAFFPTSMAMGFLGRRNLSLSLGMLPIALFITLGLTATNMAAALLIAVILTRAIHDVPLFLRLRRLVAAAPRSAGADTEVLKRERMMPEPLTSTPAEIQR